MVGVMFVINGGVYALIAPLVGMMIDKCKTPKIASICGSICIVIGFSLVGEFCELLIKFESNFDYLLQVPQHSFLIHLQSPS